MARLRYLLAAVVAISAGANVCRADVATWVVGDTLIIEGGDGPDHVVLRPGRTSVIVEDVLEGRSYAHALAGLRRVVFEGHDGDDSFVYSSSLDDHLAKLGLKPLNCDLFGGQGYDELIAGRGNDILDPGVAEREGCILSGPGADTFIVNNALITRRLNNRFYTWVRKPEYLKTDFDQKLDDWKTFTMRWH